MFERVANDMYIVEIYEKIKEYEDEDENAWAHHGYEHAMNVTIMLEKALKQQGFDEKYIDEAKVAAILHDIGCIDGKKGHAIRSYEMVKE